ncbi:MAG TPA: hypothetical protein VKB26_10130, partial [Candidatus Acidoferrales bacterium]|nr:hypothetical protein [Candidatus Acidoferrales bacterium]
MATGAQATRAQSLVYVLTYGNTPASLRAQFPNGIFGTTPKQRVAMARQRLKTEIWSVSLQGGKRTLLFSDEGTNFELIPTVDMGHSPFVGTNVAYVKGVERSWETAPPMLYETPPGVYEVSLDGSNRFRRLFDATQNMSPAMVNAAGTRAAFYGWEDKGGYFVYVYELPSAKLLTRANITKLLQAHCGSCLPQQAGWLADGKELFFVLQEGDEDDNVNETPSGAPGTSLLSEQGGDVGAVPTHAGEMNLPDYKREISIAPYMIAQAEDGSYLFLDYGLKKGPLPKAPIRLDGFLILTGPDFKVRKQIPLGRVGASEFQLTRDGTLLAYAENRELPTYRTEQHFWV